jgi:hypothetical protein
MSFTLELFDEAEISLVLREARRVLRPRGRLCVVSLVEGEGTTRRARLYQWFRRRWPRLIDCRPIPVRALLKQAAFALRWTETSDVSGLPARSPSPGTGSWTPRPPWQKRLADPLPARGARNRHGQRRGLEDREHRPRPRSVRCHRARPPWPRGAPVRMPVPAAHLVDRAAPEPGSPVARNGRSSALGPLTKHIETHLRPGGPTEMRRGLGGACALQSSSCPMDPLWLANAARQSQTRGRHEFRRG